LVSNNSSLPELVASEGILCDPVDQNDIKRGLIALIDKSTLERVNLKSMRQSWNFSWKRTWQQTLRQLM